MKLLLDTNVLLLFLAGFEKPDLIGRKRLNSFIWDDFLQVAQWSDEADGQISLPNILTETSNFIGAGEQEMFPGGAKAVATFIEQSEELYIPSQDVVTAPEYLRLGLTDTAILSLVDREVRIVSIDYHLCNRLAKSGVDVRNPLHLRPTRR